MANKKKKNGNFVEKIFKLPYDTLGVYKKLKKHRDKTNSVNEQSLGHR